MAIRNEVKFSKLQKIESGVQLTPLCSPHSLKVSCRPYYRSHLNTSPPKKAVPKARIRVLVTFLIDAKYIAEEKEGTHTCNAMPHDASCFLRTRH